MNHLESILNKEHRWWKFLVLIVILFLAFNLIGAIPLLVIAIVQAARGDVDQLANPDNMMDLSRFGISENMGLLVLIFPFIIGLVLFAVLVKEMHGQTIKEVINGTKTIRWRRFAFAFMVWGIIMGIYLIIDYSLSPETYTWHFSAGSFIPLVFIALLFIPFQATYEEVLFRGYLAQGVAAWTRNRWLVVLLPGLFFGLMHSLNPEVAEYGFWITMPQYVLFGVVFGLTTVLDDGLEVAMGAHSANNIFLSLFVTSKASALQTPALLMQETVDPSKELYALIAVMVIFVAILTIKYGWKFSVLNMKVTTDSH